MTALPARLLIVRFSSLGDIVLTAPVTRAFRQAFPGAEIVFATRAIYEPLAIQLPGVNRVLSFEPRQGLWPLIRQVRRERFDALIDLHANLRSRWLAALGGAGRTVRYNKRHLARMAMTRGMRRSIPSRHTVDLYLDTLTPFGIPAFDRLPALMLSDTARDEVATRLQAHGILPGDRILGLAPGASSPPKRWPAHYFAQAADHFAEVRHTRTLLIGSPHDREAAQGVLTAMKSPVIDWTGALGLSLLPAAIQRCQALISNDSGSMHIAAAVGVPVVGLFGPTHPCLGFAPTGPSSIAISLDLPCSPCSLHGDRPCHLKTHACLETLTAADVIGDLDRLFTAPDRIKS